MTGQYNNTVTGHYNKCNTSRYFIFPAETDIHAQTLALILIFLSLSPTPTIHSNTDMPPQSGKLCTFYPAAYPLVAVSAHSSCCRQWPEPQPAFGPAGPRCLGRCRHSGGRLVAPLCNSSLLDKHGSQGHRARALLPKAKI